MKRKGFDLTIVASPGEALSSFGAREQVATFAVEMTRRITIQRDIAALRTLVAYLHEVRPDIVHSHTPKGGLLGMVAGWLAGVPVRIYHMRGLPFLAASGWRRALLKATEQVACRLAHRVISVSHSNREVAIREGICPAEKIVVLAGGSSNGVDADERFNPARIEEARLDHLRATLGIPDGAPVVGFVGRVVRDKGLMELEQAWARVRERFPRAHLLIVGPLEPQDPIPPDVVGRLHEDPRVHLVGEASETPLLYSLMDVVTLPTYREGFPNVLLEAAAMEKPVVATRVPGCTDAVEDGETGLLVAAGAVDELASAIETYLAEPSLRRAHGEAARARVRSRFRQEVIWEALYGEYCALLNHLPGYKHRDREA